jgi:hypothetical protein
MQAAPRRPIGLRQHQSNVESGGQKALERGARECRRARKGDVHRR